MWGSQKVRGSCFFPMKVMLTVVCGCTVCYYVTPATMWPACSLTQTNHPYQHWKLYWKNGQRKKCHLKFTLPGQKVFHPWESTVSCKSLWRRRVLLLHDDAWSHSFHTTVNLNTWHWDILHHHWHHQTSTCSPKWRSTFKFYSSKLMQTSKQRLSNGCNCRTYHFTTNALTFWSNKM